MDICLIPARGGSKRIKDKNIAKIGNTTLLQNTIDQSLKSNLFDQTIISSDSEKIIKLIQNKKIYIHKRDPSISRDNSTTLELIKVLLAEDFIKDKINTLTLLQTTSPLRTIDDIKKSLNIYKKSNVDYLVSVSKLPHIMNPEKLLKLDKKNNFIRSKFYLDISGEKFHRNGPAIYISSPKYLNFCDDLYSGRGIGYVMPKSRSIDIDDYEDLKIANALFGEKK